MAILIRSHAKRADEDSTRLYSEAAQRCMGL